MSYFVWFGFGLVGALIATYKMYKLGGTDTKWLIVTGILYTITGVYGFVSAIIILCAASIIRCKVDKR